MKAKSFKSIILKKIFFIQKREYLISEIDKIK